MRRLLGVLILLPVLAAMAHFGAARAETLAGWGVNATASHATATATKTPPVGYQLILGSVEASCATTPASPVLLTVSDQTTSTVLFQTYITVGRQVTFGGGLTMTINDVAAAALADCGSGVTGSVNLYGASR